MMPTKIGFKVSLEFLVIITPEVLIIFCPKFGTYIYQPVTFVTILVKPFSGLKTVSVTKLHPKLSHTFSLCFMICNNKQTNTQNHNQPLHNLPQNIKLHKQKNPPHNKKTPPLQNPFSTSGVQVTH
jgi:hypothetical protein